jgi:adenylate kinase family enzyme
MERIMIIGCGGSGKSTLARRLSQTTGLPVHHLDRLFWKPGWTETPKTEWASLQERLCREPRWIIDGNYGASLALRLEACDTVVFLDMPTVTCLLGGIRRFLAFRGRTRPDVGDGCPEKLTGEFLRWILTYRRKRRPGILNRLHALDGEKKVVILSSRRAVRRFLAGASEGGRSCA